MDEAPFLLAALLAASPHPGHAAAVSRRAAQMGTWSEVRVEAGSREHSLELAGEALDAIDRAELLLTNWDDASEVASLNRLEPGLSFPGDPEVLAWLDEAFRWSRATAGAFDPAVGPLSRAHGLLAPRPSPPPPDDPLRPGWLIEPGAGLACRDSADDELDTGGFGKGIGLDEAAARLRARGVERALLDLGGQLLAVGGPFAVAISHPRHRQRAIGMLRLADASVATSSNAGRPAGSPHLLDPHTRRPAADFGSATVVAPTGFAADALATAMFVLGPERGLAVAATLPGVEVLFLVDRGGRGLEWRHTAGFPLGAGARAARGGR